MANRWTVASLLVATGCGGGGTPPAGPCAEPVETGGCAAVLQASGGDDVMAVQTALTEVQPGSDVCFCPGTFAFEKELSLAVSDVTLRGLGASRDDVVLDFATQTRGEDGLTVSADGFAIEHLSLKNTLNDGIVVISAEDVTFRDLHVSWDAPSVITDAYGIYPLKSLRVIVEGSEVVGATGTGIYVGQCTEVIVRDNLVHGNVAGIAIANSLDAEVARNEAYDNTTGMLVDVLPDLEQTVGARTAVYGNRVYDNNRPSVAEAGTISAAAPAGLGMLVVANDDVEIRDNDIDHNASAGVVIVSYDILTLLGVPPPATIDTDTDRYPLRIHIHENTFAANGTDPRDELALIDVTPPVEDVVWDGIVDPADRVTADPPVLCFGDTPPSFRNLHAPDDGLFDAAVQTTDTAPYECTLPSLDPVSW